MEYVDIARKFLGPEGQDAVAELLDNNRDLVISFVDPEEVCNQIVAFIRLNGESLEVESTVYDAMQTVLASLLFQKKIALKSFGFSHAGQKQHDDLLRHIGALEPEIAELTPAEKLLEQVKVDYTHLRTDELQRRLKDPSYAAAYRTMVEATQ